MRMKKTKLLLKSLVTTLVAAGLLVSASGLMAQGKYHQRAEEQEEAMSLLPQTAVMDQSPVGSKDMLLNEGFATWPPVGWSFITYAGAAGWAQYTDAGNPVARHTYSVAVNADWMVTPAIVLPAEPQLLIFKDKGQYQTYYVYHAVAVSTSADMNNPVVVYEGAGASTYTTNYVDLTAWTGQTIYVGFYYEGYDADRWHIDDVQVDLRANYGFNDILTFEFAENVEAAPAVIDANAGTVNIDVFKMYENDIDALTPVFTISQGAVVSPTVTGVQDFTNPFNIHIYAINGDHQTWTVNVGVAPGRTDTEVLAMNVANEVGTEMIDDYAKRISAKVLYDSTLVLAPSFTLSAGASIAPVVAQDFGTGFKFYTVTAEDGTTTAQWRVGITNDIANDQVEILAFDHDSLVDFQRMDTTIYGYVTVNTNLTAIAPEFDLSFGATISPVTAQNFSAGPVVYTVTSEDGEVEQEYVVYMMLEDIVAPVVTLTADASVSNVDGEVVIASTEKGIVALVKTDVVVTGAASIATATTQLKAVWAELTTAMVDTLPTFGLTAGLYKAYAIDSTGNISVPSAEITLFKDTAQVATIAQLWTGKTTVVYELTGEALLTMKQTYRNQKWIQDATAGIMIDDNANILATTYNIGDGITGLRGTILNYYNTMEFIPVAVGPAASSTGNTIEPIELAVNYYMANHKVYQSRLIKLHNMIVNDIATGGNGMFQNGKNYPSWNYEGGYVYLRTNFYDVDYIGTALPVDPINIVGIGAQYTSGTTVTQQIFPRSAADMSIVTEPLYLADAAVDFGGVNVNDSALYNFSVANVGNGELVINSIVFEGDEAFEVALGTYPDTLMAYDEMLIPVWFKPTEVAEYEGMFIVTYNGTMKDTVMVDGFGKIIPIVDLPYFTSFEDWAPEGWTMNGFTYFYNSAYSHSGDRSAYMKYGTGSMLTPGFDLSGTQHPTLEMWQNGAFAVTGTRSISVSTDLVNWEVLFDQTDGTPDITIGQPYQKLSFDLTAYAGETVYVRFLYNNPSSGLNSYWFIDDFNFLDFQENPVLTINADPIDFGYTLTTIPGTFAAELTNTGVSFVGVDTMYITGTDAALFSIEGDPSVEELYFGSALNFNLGFAPTTGGVKNATLVIKYHDALVANQTKEVALTGNGLECSTSPLVTLGMNSVPFAPYWQRFVAPTSGIVTITSSIPEQVGLDFDTRLFVYADCNSQWVGTEGHDELAFSEDISSDDFTSTVSFLAFEGTTYYIFWHDKWYSGNHDFLITLDNTPGIICELAIPITLPLENNELSGTTEFAANYYSPTTPGISGLCNPDFTKGYDLVYTFTLAEQRTISGSIDGYWVGMHIIDGILSLPGNNGDGECFAFASNGSGHINFNKVFPAGTYYILVSSFPASLSVPQFSEFTIHLTMAPTTADVTFNVNMEYQIAAGFFDPAIHQVKVGALEFEPETMTDEDGDSIYTVTLAGLTIGETIHYAYAFAGEGTDTTFEDTAIHRMHTVVAGENIRNDLFNNWTTINEVELMSNLKVFPNPNNGQFSLTLNSGKALTIEVVNMKGQVVYNNQLNASGNHQIDLTSIAKGVYYLKVNNGHSVKVEKVVVE